MSRTPLAGVTLAALLLLTSDAGAADMKSIDQAIDKGKSYLKTRYGRGVPDANAAFGIGPAALSGVAMLEARVPADDPAIKAITAAVREAAYSEVRTYQVALCLIYLDRLEDPADVPMIQVLALRLLAGQKGNGGWGYNTAGAVSGEQLQWLKANLKVEPPKEPKDPKSKPVPRLHPDVATYANSIQRSNEMGADDNSNTQFAILGLWLARKHGAPVEAALDQIEKRFRGSQSQNGGWGYFGPAGSGPAIASMTSASMTCCGLLGLATGNARRIEKRPKEAVLKTPMAKGDEPFFSSPSKTEKTADKGPEIRDPAALVGLKTLGSYLAAEVQNNSLLAPNDKHGDRDLYLLWSVERVGVIYNVDKLGGVDWYEAGSTVIVKAQGQDGSWGSGHHYGADVNTSFALLFLCKADLLRDLSNKFRNAKDNELRAGNSGAAPSGSGNGGTPEIAPMPKGNNIPGTTPLPSPVEDASTKLANQLVLAPATDWTKSLEKLRDAKGAENTRGLVIAIQRLDGDRKKEAREALAERLFRMSADTLRAMMKEEDVELRRGAVLAAAMRDDKSHVPDLIDRLEDDEIVVRAAKAGLKSLTSQDFGPKAGASADERKAAVAAWKAWWARQKP